MVFGEGRGGFSVDSLITKSIGLFREAGSVTWIIMLRKAKKHLKLVKTSVPVFTQHMYPIHETCFI